MGLLGELCMHDSLNTREAHNFKRIFVRFIFSHRLGMSNIPKCFNVRSFLRIFTPYIIPSENFHFLPILPPYIIPSENFHFLLICPLTSFHRKISFFAYMPPYITPSENFTHENIILPKILMVHVFSKFPTVQVFVSLIFENLSFQVRMKFLSHCVLFSSFHYEIEPKLFSVIHLLRPLSTLFFWTFYIENIRENEDFPNSLLPY